MNNAAAVRRHCFIPQNIFRRAVAESEDVMLSEQNQIALMPNLSRSGRSALQALDFRQSALPLPEGEVLHTLCLLCGDHPGQPSAHGLPLLEGLLPDIRLLAVLSASRRQRFDGSCTPAQLSDEADWLAARILVLGAEYVQLTPAQLPLLTQANLRLRELAQVAGCRPVCAAAMLTVENTPGQTMRFCSSTDHDLIAIGNDPLMLSREMARRGRARVAAILRAFGAL